MIFISYFTQNTPYEEVMNDYLLPCLEKWELKYDIQEVKNLGSWQNNTSYKPTFILEMLEKHKEDVVFLDADATIEQYPKLFFEIPNEYNIACHWLDWYKFWKNTEGESKRHLLSGTMMIRYNLETVDYIKKWIDACKNSTQWEQRILQQIIEKDNYKTYNLPIEYCAIKKENRDLIDNAVIVHHQVSRQYRNKIT